MKAVAADVTSLTPFMTLARVSRLGDIEGEDGSEEVTDDDDVNDGEDEDGEDDVDDEAPVNAETDDVDVKDDDIDVFKFVCCLARFVFSLSVFLAFSR